ncbi:xanthine permease XanP [candidate division KSB3 bacterium]|uniref:Xanthine permease XanP n=1 Tax=candidate division KSB3 bacterium TaxID=2044937 RepID=A0A2G6EAX6_9BACT|nr:MAG: xanthine permease XanP [candidate division KSB3 bacterium]PIE30731.1 MAG: xanthine permease XanP [candidate division KSB3 bacterium]
MNQSYESERTQEQQKQAGADIIYGLNDTPPILETLFAALQHLLAIFVGIVSPTLIISGALGLDLATSSYLVSMALFVSGLATLIQIRKIGPIGSGLLSIQGTSFTFLGTCIGIGKDAGLSAIFGTCLAGSPIEMIVSRFIPHAKKVITPLVSGIVVTMIGATLIRVGITSCAGGFASKSAGTFGSFKHLGMAALVLFVIILFNRSKNPFLRMSSIVIGMGVGYIVSAFLGWIDFSALKNLEMLAIPIPFKYGISFSLSGFIAILLLYVITTIESIGDLTATSLVSGEPIKGDLYMKRIAGGVLGDGFNSALAAVFNTFPNTTFSQNNGVIQLTGVASRRVGYAISGLLMLIGIFPVVGGVFKLMPEPVLGGGTLIMFGTIAAAGIKIISSNVIDRRGLLIIAISFGFGLGVTFEPGILDHFPPLLKSIFNSGITTGGLTAILANILLPKSLREKKVERLEEEIGI